MNKLFVIFSVALLIASTSAANCTGAAAITDCITCNTDGTHCDACDTGKFLNAAKSTCSATCAAAIPNCDTCTTGGATCETCSSTSYGVTAKTSCTSCATAITNCI